MKESQDILDINEFDDSFDSVGSEFIQNTEKSISQKIRDQTRKYDKKLFDTVMADVLRKKFERKSSHQNLIINKCSLTSQELTQINSLNTCRNNNANSNLDNYLDSTDDIISKRVKSNYAAISHDNSQDNSNDKEEKVK